MFPSASSCLAGPGPEDSGRYLPTIYLQCSPNINELSQRPKQETLQYRRLIKKGREREGQAGREGGRGRGKATTVKGMTEGAGGSGRAR